MRTETVSRHVRLRKFNTRDTYPGTAMDNDLCQVVKAGDLIFLRGQVGSDFEGNVIGAGDPAAQADQAMRNVKQLLEEAGATLEDICKITVYVTDRAYRESVYQVIGKWLKGVYPVSTGLIVQGLAKPEWVMEIDVIASLAEDDGSTAHAR